MRIGFDASPLHRPHPPGVVRVVRESLRALEKRGQIQVVRLAPGPDVPLRHWRQRQLPGELRRRGLAGLHSFLSAFPLRGPGLRVQTLHELPWKHQAAENADLRHRFWAWYGPRRADAVITGTNYVARDIGLTPAREGGKLFVVPWGVDAQAFAGGEPSGSAAEALRKRLGLPAGPFALCLGAVRAKKNLAALLSGVARLNERGGPELSVCVTGPDTPQLAADLDAAARLPQPPTVVALGIVADEDLPALLSLAAVVPILSTSEGFALPVLEAMACGTPVLVPLDSAQAEVADSAGIAVAVQDADEIAAGLKRALEGRAELRVQALARAETFPWSRTARGIEEVWRSLL